MRPIFPFKLAPRGPSPSSADLSARSVEGRLIYAVGDVHGCYDQLIRLLTKIVADADGRANGRLPVLIFCGDYVDRGPASAAVLDALCWLQRSPSFELHLLKGNHEAVFIDCLRNPKRLVEWHRYGGDATMRSYGLPAPDPDDPDAEWELVHQELLQAVPLSHWTLLQNLKLMVTIGDYAFVHAGVRHDTPLNSQLETDLLWIRQGFVDSDAPLEKIVVHGHSWADSTPHFANHRIGVDTGAYATGKLTAVRLEDGEVGFLDSS